jgi:DegV family protein with EDD domain
MIRIVTDSTCDLNQEQASQIGIDAIARLYVRFGTKTFQDGITLTSEQFQNLLKTDPNFPSTSQPSIGDFAQIYERFKGDQIVSIHISGDLSGTLASAQAARDLVGGDITVIDSRNVNAGLALLVMRAARMAQQGATVAQIKQQIEALVTCTRLVFALGTLENLRRGGRIGAAQAFLGSMLQFKPLITVKDGRIEPIERVRTMSKAVARLREIAAHDLQGNPHPEVVFMHAAAPAAANELVAAFTQQVKLEDPLLIEAGPVVATHSGPGAVGIAYIVE